MIASALSRQLTGRHHRAGIQHPAIFARHRGAPYYAPEGAMRRGAVDHPWGAFASSRLMSRHPSFGVRAALASAQPPERAGGPAPDCVPPRAPPALALWANPPTVRSQLDFFAGAWTVRGWDEETELQACWRGKFLFFTHPPEADGRLPRYADYFDYENPSYVRRDLSPNPRPMFVSGGWVGDKFEWQRVDCSARITYEKIDANTLLVTEEEREGACGAGERGPYEIVRQFEARRQV